VAVQEVAATADILDLAAGMTSMEGDGWNKLMILPTAWVAPPCHTAALVDSAEGDDQVDRLLSHMIESACDPVLELVADHNVELGIVGIPEPLDRLPAELGCQ
jgi:phage major head subunit gpT-like protein